MSKMAKLAAEVRRRGFDKLYVGADDDGYKSVSVNCSQCQAVVINGMACHERGCPNTVR